MGVRPRSAKGTKCVRRVEGWERCVRSRTRCGPRVRSPKVSPGRCITSMLFPARGAGRGIPCGQAGSSQATSTCLAGALTLRELLTTDRVATECKANRLTWMDMEAFLSMSSDGLSAMAVLSSSEPHGQSRINRPAWWKVGTAYFSQDQSTLGLSGTSRATDEPC